MVLELERADRMRDPLERIRDAVRVVVERIDAPRVAGAVVRRVADPVDRRIAHVHVRAAHVDLEPQHMRAVGKLARAHPAEEVEVLRDRPAAVRAVAPRFRQRAARRAHLLGRLAVDVGEAVLDEPLGEAVEVVVVVGRVVAMVAPVVAQPAHGLRDRILELDFLLQRIGVVVAQVARAAVLGGQPEVEDDRLGVTVVQVAVGLGRKPRDDAAAVLPGAVVLGDDRAQEIGRRRGASPRRADAAAWDDDTGDSGFSMAASGSRTVAVQHSSRFCS